MYILISFCKKKEKSSFQDNLSIVGLYISVTKITNIITDDDNNNNNNKKLFVTKDSPQFISFQVS